MPLTDVSVDLPDAEWAPDQPQHCVSLVPDRTRPPHVSALTNKAPSGPCAGLRPSSEVARIAERERPSRQRPAPWIRAGAPALASRRSCGRVFRAWAGL